MKSYVWRSYRGPLIVGAVMAILIALINGVFQCETALALTHVLCDAFCISGGIILCVGGLCWVSSTGMFDSLIYSTRQFGQLFRPAEQRQEETLEQYVERKRSHPVFLRPYFFVGGIYMAIGLIFLAAFYSLY